MAAAVVWVTICLGGKKSKLCGSAASIGHKVLVSRIGDRASRTAKHAVNQSPEGSCVETARFTKAMRKPA